MMCQNASLENLVLDVVNDFIHDSSLFTALDVSNKVKETMPAARHREVRDVVRAAWTSVIEPSGYGRSPINVTLADGSVTEALLYHPLSDSWDLDNKYDIQKRAQTSAKPQTSSGPVAVTAGNQNVSVASDGSISVVSVTPIMTAPVPAPKPAVPAIQAQANARDLWAQLFNSQPSLFPRR